MTAHTAYLVHRLGETITGADAVAFTTEDLADSWRSQRETAEPDGGIWTVTPITVLDDAVTSRTRHTLTVCLALDGTETWRKATVTHRLGHRDSDPADKADWAVIVRTAPSQPPSHIRITACGSDPDWCENQIQTCWDQARASDTWREATAVENMFADQP